LVYIIIYYSLIMTELDSKEAHFKENSGIDRPSLSWVKTAEQNQGEAKGPQVIKIGLEPGTKQSNGILGASTVSKAKQQIMHLINQIGRIWQIDNKFCFFDGK